MAIEVCVMCKDPFGLRPGPRNQKLPGICKRAVCNIKAGLELAREDMLSREEADRLNAYLGG